MRFRVNTLGFGLCLVVALCVTITLIWLPEWMVNQYGGSGERLSRLDYTKTVDDCRRTIAQIIAGFALLVGLYFTWRTTRLAEDGRITDRFSKAVELLGTSNKEGERQMEPRLGGIYALERIARESKRDHGPIMEIFCAYIRHNAPRLLAEGDPETGEVMPEPYGAPPPSDIAAVLSVLKRRSLEHETKAELSLDLHEAELCATDLKSAVIPRVRLYDARLSRAILVGADLTEAHLSGCFAKEAHFEEATLRGADMNHATLAGSKFRSCDLSGVDLQGSDLQRCDFHEAHFGTYNGAAANLSYANLLIADLRGVDLTEVIGLSAQQLKKATIDDKTKLPDSISNELALLKAQDPPKSP